MRPPKSAKRDALKASFHSGFAAFIGRPNVGKSTLMNSLVGEKVAITSAKPQTTRHAIRGIVNRPDGQLILVDTPGIHRPRTLLGERLNALAKSTLGDVDIIGMCFPADEPVGKGDRYIAEQLGMYPRAITVAIVTKTDVASREMTAKRLLEVSELREWNEIVPVSALTADHMDDLAQTLIRLLPSGPAFYDEETITDDDSEKRISELIRESLLETLQDELPHSLAVTIDEMVERHDKDLLEIYANIFVERDSQKAIIIGKAGARLKETGAISRRSIEELLGRHIFLSIRVKVAKDWQRDPNKRERLGF
jgi:GTP-binding protein Era